MTRYLPAKAWSRLTPEQRKATIAKKLQGDKTGRQFVPNTERAAKVSKRIREKSLKKNTSTKNLSPFVNWTFG
jgi:hypothetical protein